MARSKIYNLIKNELSRKKLSPKHKIPLSVPTFDYQEICEALDSMLSTKLTMGEKVKKFEKAFAKYVGEKHAIMVNSGSSANLITFSILASPHLKKIQPGDEVITTAIPWSTTVFPILQVGAIPVFVDVELENFNLNVKQIEDAITPKTKAIMPVHLLGNPADMEAIMEIAGRHNLNVIEDACEAHGAKFSGKKVGSFGDLSTFSFFFSHHISTIEGGMVLTNDELYADFARSIRAHGWIRELKSKDDIAQKYPYIDERFLFFTAGYNLRPTEIQGAFGIHQLKKLEKFIQIRRRNARHWTRALKKYSDCLLVHNERKNARHVWLGYPILVKPTAPFNKSELTHFLELKGIETRPVMAGNMIEHPVMEYYPYRKINDLPVAHLVMKNAFYIGNHQEVGREERNFVLECIKEFVENRTGK